MMDDPRQSPRDHRLDEMTAALREAGAAESQALPPEVRRTALQALWEADAARYERSSVRNAKWLRLAGALVVVLAVLGLGAVVATLGYRSWVRSVDPWRRPPVVRSTVAPPATGPATQIAAADDAPQGTTTAPPAAQRGAVVGRVVFLGTPPTPEVIYLGGVRECQAMHPTPLLDESLIVGSGGGLANVVVSIESADGAALRGNAPSAPAVLDQKGCRYIPHVLAVSVNQPIIVKNSDPFLHNVRSLAIDNPGFNFGQPNIDPGRKLDPIKVAERFKIKCDIHPWMGAYVNVFDHPYFAITGADGAFSIPGTLPDGQYTLTAWHEKLGEKQAFILVKGGKPASTDFVFDGASLPAE